MDKNTLVIGGTGTVGGEVVRGLLEQGAAVRVLVRSPEKAQRLPTGVEGVVGDLAEPRTLPPAFQGVESVFLITPLSPEETMLGRAAVQAAKAARVPQLVYMTVHRLMEAAHVPHFRSKIPVVKAIKDSGLSYTLLEPNNFFQNDLGFRDVITQMGVYPQPLGPGTSRVDVRDIADAALNVLSGAGHEGQAYPLVGPEPLTGEQVAEIWGRQLGREVRYTGDDLDAWEAGARQMLPDWMVKDLRIMFDHISKEGLFARPEDLERSQEIVGHPPRSFDAFAAEVAADWRG